MSIPVRQSTAFELSIGPVLDADGVAVTDCVVADFKIKKTTGAFAALNASATLTHVSAGTYDLVLTTSDLDTVGLATIAIDDTVNACAPVRLQVIEEAIYDALFAASANAWSGAAGSSIGVANATQLAGQTITAAAGVTFPTSIASPTNITAGTITTVTNLTNLPAITANWLTAAGIADDAFTAAKFATGAFTADAFAANALVAATFAADVTTAFQSGLATTANVAAVETDTQDIQNRLPAALTANGNIKASLVEILTTALTETAGLLAAGFKKFFNVASPTGTLNSLPDAVPGAAGGVFIAGSNAATTAATWTVTGATTLTGNVALGGTLTVTGATSLAALSMTTLTASGAVALQSTVTVTGATTLTGGMTGNITGNLSGSVGSVTTKTGYELTSAYDFAKGTVAMTEDYAANGAAPTPVESLFAIHQMLMSFGIAGTSITVRKLNNSDTAFIVTLDDDTDPTSTSRA